MDALPIFVMASLAAVVGGCGSSANEPPAEGAARTSVATATGGGLTVELLTDHGLETGLTPIHLKIAKTSGLSVTDASVTFFPTMSMSGVVEHSAPLTGPPSIAADGLYHTAAVFLMPTTDTGVWGATVTIAKPSVAPVEVTLSGLNVRERASIAVFSHTDPVSSVERRYVTSLNFVASPAIGLNPIVLTLHQTPDMLTFVPVDDATIVLDPQMPAMGHGSPGSVNPVLTSPGLYEGKLSFSMAGTWQTTATIAEAKTAVGAPIFKTTF